MTWPEHVDQLREPKLNVQQVANILGVSKMAVYRAVANDEITSYRVGRQIRIPLFAVRAYLDAHIDGGAA